MKQNENYEAFKDLIHGLKNIKELKTEFDTGTVKITVFPIVPGLYLSLNEVTGSSIPFDENVYDYELTTINQCIYGRCEFRHPGESVSYISPQLTCIARKRKMNAFYYPLGYYTGIEISIIEELIDESTKRLLSLFSINIASLINKYLTVTETYIGRSDSPLLSLFNELYLFIEKKSLGRVRLKVLEILYYLLKEDIPELKDSHYLTSGQVAMARHVNDILTSDLSKHIAIKDIAVKLNVSETSLKNYFKEVYGTCISEYMKNKRMKFAADKLQNTSLSILDIANSVGYTNQGRFAKVFNDFYNMNPLEYRRNMKSLAEARLSND